MPLLDPLVKRVVEQNSDSEARNVQVTLLNGVLDETMLVGETMLFVIAQVPLLKDALVEFLKTLSNQKDATVDVETPALAIMMPVLTRGLNDKSGEIRRTAV